MIAVTRAELERLRPVFVRKTSRSGSVAPRLDPRDAMRILRMHAPLTDRERGRLLASLVVLEDDVAHLHRALRQSDRAITTLLHRTAPRQVRL